MSFCTVCTNRAFLQCDSSCVIRFSSNDQTETSFCTICKQKVTLHHEYSFVILCIGISCCTVCKHKHVLQYDSSCDICLINEIFCCISCSLQAQSHSPVWILLCNLEFVFKLWLLHAFLAQFIIIMPYSSVILLVSSVFLQMIDLNHLVAQSASTNLFSSDNPLV